MYKYDSTTPEPYNIFEQLGFQPEESNVLRCKSLLQMDCEELLGFDSKPFTSVTLEMLLIHALRAGYTFQLEIKDGNKE